MNFRTVARTTLYAIAAGALLTIAAVACGGGSNPTATPEPTPTPVPTATPTPAPLTPLRVDSSTAPESIIAQLPPSEVACASEAAGGMEQLATSLDNDSFLTAERYQAIAGCLSTASYIRLFTGTLEGEADITLSQSTLACITAQSEGLDVAALMAGDIEDAGKLFEVFFCLNAEERAALGNSDLGFTGEQITQIECLTGKLGIDAQSAFMAMLGETPGGGPQFADMMAASVECGIISEDDLGEGDVSLNDLTCLANAPGDPFGAAIAAAQTGREPTDEEVAAIEAAAAACGLDPGELGLGFGDEVSAEAGQPEPSGTPDASISPLTPQQIPIPGPATGLKVRGFSAGEMACLAANADAEVLKSVSADGGEVSSSAAIALFAAASACNIDPAGIIVS